MFSNSNYTIEKLEKYYGDGTLLCVKSKRHSHAVLRSSKKYKTFPKRHILDPSKLNEFADDNFKLAKMVESSPKGRKLFGNRRDCSLRSISPFFPNSFQSTYTAAT